VKDDVSLWLESRVHAPLRWSWALAGALALHLIAAAAVIWTPTHPRRALRLPSVQVRLTAPLTPPPVPASPAPRPAAAQSRPARDVTASKPKPKASPPPARKTTSRKVAPAATAVPTAEPAAGGGAGAGGAAGGDVRSPSGSLGLGSGEARSGESFPYTYYLSRFLAMIESNWYRPPAPQGTHCRVLCRIDRTGRLLEAGIEEPSATPAFDRSALRAVYASTPFPPLPQGFGGVTLTLHLEFGP
jgi:protein TonB